MSLTPQTGNVNGPNSSTINDIVTFGSTDGGTIQDSGKQFTTDGTLSADSDALIPTEKAVKTYVDTAVTGANHARGSYDASGNVYPSTGGSGSGGAILQGDYWNIAVAGILGGETASVGDILISDANTPGQTSSNWTLINNGTYVANNGTSADNAIPRFNGTSGKFIENTGTTIDDNNNILVNNYLANATATISAGGITTLTAASSRFQALTGSLSQTYQLPDATTLSLGPWFVFNNNSSGSLIITNAGGSTLYTVPAGGIVECGPTSIGTTNGTWDFHGFYPGTVTWSSGSTGLIFNTALSTSPQINAGTSSATSPSFIPQRGSSTTGYGGDSTHLYGVIGGTTSFTSSSTAFNVPSGSNYQINGSQISASNLSNGVSGSGAVVLATGGNTTGNAGTATALQTGRTISITGDLAYTSPTFDGSGNVTAAGTLATVNSNVGSFGSATQTGTFTVNEKGLITAASNTTVTPAIGSVTGLGTGVATFLATPSSANLAAAVTDETGSGSLVFATSPTLTTPNLGTPSAINLSNATSLAAAALPSGSLFNFQQGKKTDTASTSSTTFADTGISVSITPTSSSNSVLVRAVICCSGPAAAVTFFRLVRASTTIGVGDAASSRTQISNAYYEDSAAGIGGVAIEWLDSPSTTSSTTYKVQWAMNNTGTGYLNRSVTDSDSSAYGRGVSTISVCEVKA